MTSKFARFLMSTVFAVSVAAMAQTAAMTAFDASKADTTPEKFKELGTQLRAACDGCHAKFMHVEGPSKP